jgi:S-DNA-T family DNA segregation ATPase FtsK/SpoIIIE
MAFPIIIPIITVVASALILGINKEGSTEKFFKNLQLVNTQGETLKILKTKTYEWGKTKTILMPVGITTNELEEKRLQLEEFFQGKIDIVYTGNDFCEISIYDESYFGRTFDFDPNFKILNKDSKPEKIIVPLGLSRQGKVVELEISPDLPACVVAGMTRWGKTTIVNTIITYIALHHKIVTMDLIDLKGYEFPVFENLSCVRQSVCDDDPDKAVRIIKNNLAEMANRRNLFKSKKVNTIYAYNRICSPSERLQPHLLVVDEFKNLLDAGDDAAEAVDKLVRLCGASGIFVMLATQRPDKDTIKGAIKANVGTFIAVKAANRVNSEIILDRVGAEEIRYQGQGIIKQKDYEDFKGYYIEPDMVRKYLKDLYVDKSVKPAAKTEQLGKGVWRREDGDITIREGRQNI